MIVVQIRIEECKSHKCIGHHSSIVSKVRYRLPIASEKKKKIPKCIFGHDSRTYGGKFEKGMRVSSNLARGWNHRNRKSVDHGKQCHGTSTICSIRTNGWRRQARRRNPDECQSTRAKQARMCGLWKVKRTQRDNERLMSQFRVLSIEALRSRVRTRLQFNDQNNIRV